MSREAFEKAYQPDVKKSPFPFFKFNEETNLYESYDPFFQRQVDLINAAWWAWQEQQKRIDQLEEIVRKDRYENKDFFGEESALKGGDE